MTIVLNPLETGEPGVFTGVSFEDYVGIRAVNQSTLKKFDRSPLHVLHSLTTPSASTPALEFGTAFHSAVLEPDDFKAGYAIAPAGDKRTKAYKEFAKENAGKKILSSSDADTIQHMHRAVQSHPEAHALLSEKGESEVSLVWLDGAKRKTLCKARADRIANVDGVAVVVDLKTTLNVCPGDFARSAATFGYHFQAAWYLRGLSALAPSVESRRFIIIAVEKSPPFAVAVYELDDEAIFAGDRKVSEYLAKWEECNERNDWPMPAGVGVRQLSLPPWALGGGGE